MLSLYKHKVASASPCYITALPPSKYLLLNLYFSIQSRFCTLFEFLLRLLPRSLFNSLLASIGVINISHVTERLQNSSNLWEMQQKRKNRQNCLNYLIKNVARLCLCNWEASRPNPAFSFDIDLPLQRSACSSRSRFNSEPAAFLVTLVIWICIINMTPRAFPRIDPQRQWSCWEMEERFFKWQKRNLLVKSLLTIEHFPDQWTVHIARLSENTFATDYRIYLIDLSLHSL